MQSNFTLKSFKIEHADIIFLTAYETKCPKITDEREKDWIQILVPEEYSQQKGPMI